MAFNFNVIVYGVIGAIVVGGIMMIFFGDISNNTTLSGDGWNVLYLGVGIFILRIVIKLVTKK